VSLTPKVPFCRFFHIVFSTTNVDHLSRNNRALVDSGDGRARRISLTLTPGA
jgi:hypothetical protein